MIAGLRRLFGLGGRPHETRSTDMSALTWEALLGGPSKSGVGVNVDTALRVTTVLACCRVLAEGIAQMPLKVCHVGADGSLRPALEHPTYKLLHRRPNDWMTSFELRETMMFHAVLTGDAYAYKNIVNGQVRELLPVVPGACTPIQHPDYSLVYQIADPLGGIIGTFPREQIMHLRGPSWNGYLGMDAVILAREAIGLSIATEESHASLHRNGARPGGILSFDNALSPEARDRIKKAWEGRTGVQNAYKTAIFDAGAKWTPMAFTGVDAQHLETRRFQIEEICRALRVLPIMIGYYDKAATYASSEQMFIAHLVHHVMPWVERWQQTIKRDLLDGKGEDDLEARFNVRGMLRGDAASMAAYYASGIVNGWLTRNEARIEESLDPLDGLSEPLAPLNMGLAPKMAADVVAAVKSSLIGHNGGPSLDDDQCAELELKIGRVLSQTNERRITSARDELTTVLASLQKSPA